MVRMVLYLVVAMGGIMYFADQLALPVPQDTAKPAIKTDTEILSDVPAAKAVAVVKLDKLAGVKVIEPRPIARANESERQAFVPFDKPRVVLSNGDIMPEAAIDTIQEAAAIAPDVPAINVRYVTANRVNVRQGPSTEFPVIGGVDYADAVEIISDIATPWVHIRVEGAGVEGFMSARFLDKNQPGN